MGIMASPLRRHGLPQGRVAAVTKVYGVIMTLAGAFAGGALALRLGVMRVLMLGALLSAVSNPAVCPGWPAMATTGGADRGDLRRQPEFGHRVGSLRRLPVWPDQRDYSATQ